MALQPALMTKGLLAALGAAGAMAFSPARAEPCALPGLGEGRVAGVIDGRSFRLDDGREVRLAAIEVPLLPRAGEEASAPALAARAALERLIDGKAVALQGHAATDRYGRLIAFARVADRSVQNALLAQGFARAGADLADRDCAHALLQAENGARTAKLGLWADPVYQVLRADEPAAILSARGQFAVVEGKVLSVRTSRGTIYVNFARRWSDGFAVTIRERDARRFTAFGVEPKKLEGQEVRVRGWVEVHNGPRIAAARPEQIEVTGQD
jgi:endonuclease YncB( thermonuclease family)